MSPEEEKQARMQALADAFMLQVDADLKTNGPMEPKELLLTLAAFAAGTFEALEVKVGASKDTIFRVYLSLLLHVMEEPAPELPDTEEKPN